MPVDPNCYCVKQNGRKVQTGFSQTEAYRYAQWYAENMDRKNASSRRITPVIEVCVDKDMVERDDELYKWAKNGG